MMEHCVWLRESYIRMKNCTFCCLILSIAVMYMTCLMEYRFQSQNQRKNSLSQRRKTARILKDEYDEAKRNVDALNEAVQYFIESVKTAGQIIHKKFGICNVLSVDSKYIYLKIQSTGEERQLGFMVVVANGIIRVDSKEFDVKRNEYLDMLKNADSIPRKLEYAAHALEPYEEYLEQETDLWGIYMNCCAMYSCEMEVDFND